MDKGTRAHNIDGKRELPVFSTPRLLESHRWNNKRIGLLGGSFNPPHEGHIHISMAAMRALKLDVVWWLVTPQNPLKNLTPMPLQKRIEMCDKLVAHPQIIITDIEKDLDTNITYYTVCEIKKNFPKSEFVWISGMDNALSLHKWNYWQELLGEICMVHLSRKPAASLIRNCPLKLYSKQKHIFIDKACDYPLTPNTTYWMMQKKMIHISSTEIRAKSEEYQ